MDNLDFNINERYELLKEELSLLQAEYVYLNENAKSLKNKLDRFSTHAVKSPTNEKPVSSEKAPLLSDEISIMEHAGISIQNDTLEFFSTRKKAIQLRLEILAKSEYLEKLGESIAMDTAEADRDYANLDIDALLDRASQYPKENVRIYAKLTYMLTEFKFFQNPLNKEAIVFYAKGITKLLNGE